MGFFDFGGSNRKTNHRNTTKNHKQSNNKIVIGKIYADWCGACKQLQGNWSEMKTTINNENTNMFEFSEIEEKVMKPEIAKINKKYNVNLELQGGYPTIFKIANGKLEYYNGGREPNQMLSWFKPTKNLIRPADSHSSWSMTDKDINPSPEGADLNLQRFKGIKHVGGRKSKKSRKSRKSKK